MGFPVQEGRFVADRHVDELPLPDGVFLSAILRNGLPLATRDSARLEPGDFACFIARPASVDQLSTLFDPHVVPSHLTDQRYYGEFTLNGDATLGEVANAYAITVPPDACEMTLHAYLSRAFHNRAVVGDVVLIGSAQLVVREIEDGVIRRVGLRLPKH